MNKNCFERKYLGQLLFLLKKLKNVDLKQPKFDQFWPLKDLYDQNSTNLDL